MARWITWAMQQNNGDVLVVCGGWHAPALANMWRECPQEINKPELSSLADAVTGCYLTPYSEKRLDVLAGYLSGMPAPVWQNWCWQCGLQQAGEQLLKTVLTRLRQHKLPASTADMAAAHLNAMALAQLRGHTLPLRTDWLDAIAGSLIKEALNAPLPWSYRGVIHPDTDPGGPLQSRNRSQSASAKDPDKKYCAGLPAYPPLRLPKQWNPSALQYW